MRFLIKHFLMFLWPGCAGGYLAHKGIGPFDGFEFWIVLIIAFILIEIRQSAEKL